MNHRIARLVQVALVVTAFAATGCGKKSAPPVEADVTTPEDTTAPTDQTPPPRDDTVAYRDPNSIYPGVFVPIYFDYDRYSISDEAKPVLEKIASTMKTEGDWKILVEGHCDERGTNEYNLGLGEQRAQATKHYLSSLGVEESRIQTVSYGEERPAGPGHDDSAWEKNRRAEFKVEAPRS